MRASLSQAIHTALPWKPPSRSPHRRCSWRKSSRAASKSRMEAGSYRPRAAKVGEDGLDGEGVLDGGDHGGQRALLTPTLAVAPSTAPFQARRRERSCGWHPVKDRYE